MVGEPVKLRIVFTTSEIFYYKNFTIFQLHVSWTRIFLKMIYEFFKNKDHSTWEI